MNRKNLPFKFPKGFICKKIADSRCPREIISCYIFARFYRTNEIEMTFWMLVFNGYIEEAVILGKNEKQTIDDFFMKMSKVLGLRPD